MNSGKRLEKKHKNHLENDINAHNEFVTDTRRKKRSLNHNQIYVSAKLEFIKHMTRIFIPEKKYNEFLFPVWLHFPFSRHNNNKGGGGRIIF